MLENEVDLARMAKVSWIYRLCVGTPIWIFDSRTTYKCAATISEDRYFSPWQLVQ